MNAYDIAQSVPHLFSFLDDSTVSVLAMLVGVIGGWTLTGLHQKMKAERVKLAGRRRMNPMRKPD